MRKSRNPKPRPRGRPRSDASKQAVLRAAYRLLKKRGIASVSAQELARQAGVSTATLYRWWKSKEAVMLDAFLARVKPALAPPLEGSPLERLHQSVVRGAAWLHSKDAPVAVRLISDVQADPVLRRLFLERLETTRSLAARVVDLNRRNRYERRATFCGFKSCPQDRGAATVVAIGLLLKGFAGARNQHYLQLWRPAA